MATYVQIATYTATGSVSSIDFTSIPSTYTDLIIKYSLRSTANAATQGGQLTKISFNGSTANLSRRRLYGNGSSAGSDSASDNIIGYNNPSDYTANTFGNGELYVPNYAGSANKSFSVDSVDENNATAAEIAFVAGLWSQTTAINAISLIPYAGNWVQYSTATLYGIKSS